LDPRFFQLVSTTPMPNTRGSVLLESYRALYERYTMVLFSRKTQTPLAALTLRSGSVQCLCNVTAGSSSRETSATHFRGMLSLPHQTFSFTISNLSDEAMINFNVLRASEDSGPSCYGVNEVNELRPNQSYTIDVDQRTQRRLVLGAGNRKRSGRVYTKTKVREDVKITTDEELYFNLSVAADIACPSLVSKYEEGTIWKVVQGFILRRPNRSPSPRVTTVMDRSNSNGRIYTANDEVTFNPFELDGETANDEVTFNPFELDGERGEGASLDSWSEILSFNPLHLGESEDESSGVEIREEQSTNASPTTASPTTPRRRGRRRRNLCRIAAPLGGPASRQVEAIRSGTGTSSQRQLSSLNEHEYNDNVPISSGYSGHEYFYENLSEPTVLCLAIQPDLTLPRLPNIEKELAAQIDSLMNDPDVVLSHIKVHKTETCVIDLESEADTVIFPCGHQCINHANASTSLQNCPMCRTAITGFLCVNKKKKKYDLRKFKSFIRSRQRQRL